MERDLKNIKDKLDYLVSLFKGLSQEHRIRILLLLISKGSATFSELSNELNISSGKLNFHLRKLVDAGLISISSGGAYQLTDKGKWVVAKISEILGGSDELPPIIDYRGLPFDAQSSSDLLRRATCGSGFGEVEVFLNNIMEKFSKLKAKSINGEILLLLIETIFCEKVPNYICIPSEVGRLSFKSFTDEAYAYLRDSVAHDLASRYAIHETFPLFYEYQSKGLIYLKDPIYTVVGAQAVVLNVSKGENLLRIVSKLISKVSELVLVLEYLPKDQIEIIDNLISPKKITFIVKEEFDGDLPIHNVGVAFKTLDSNNFIKKIIRTANNPIPVLLFRGENVPSLSLASLPLPEPSEAYVLPLRVAVSLPSLYLFMKKRTNFDSYHFITLIADECVKVIEKFQSIHIQKILKNFAKNIEILEPQMALLGFESAMLLHHTRLTAPRLIELTKRFWSMLSKDLPVKIVASLADEKVYSIVRDENFSALSAFSPKLRRNMEELALLEGILQQILKGGSALPIKIKGYLDQYAFERIINLIKSNNIFNVSMHLEFTKCKACSTIISGRRAICDACLSSNVAQLVRPLTIYEPIDAVPAAVLREYESRIYL